MDAITIALEFDSQNRKNIEKDIWSNDRNFVDFNILCKCPTELEYKVSGSSENAAVEIVKKHCKIFELETKNVREDIRTFIEEHKEEDFFLERELFNSDPQNMESVINSVIAYQKYGYGNWYQFKLYKWGVPHNAFEFGRKRRTKNGGFYFVCGGIPNKWLEVLSEKWPEVSFKIFYRMQFDNIKRNGKVFVLTYKNGKQISKKQVERSF
jgi:hypothetical protein